jgi:hypothetical protein
MDKSCSGAAGGIADGRLTQGDDPVLTTIEVALEALD